MEGQSPIRLPPCIGLNARFPSVATTEDLLDSHERPNRMLESFETLSRINVRMPIGWIRSRSQQFPTDKEDEDRCHQIYQAFDETFRNTYVKTEDLLFTNDEVLDACWDAFQRGRDPARGTKDKTISGVALERNPASMSHASALKLKKYQLQDIASAIQIESNLCSSLLSHDMGMGKTVQSIAQAERRKELNLSSTPNQATLQRPRTTLVVVPAGLIGQWFSDLSKNVTGKIFDYSLQPQKNYQPSELAEFDYIVCSYDRLSMEFRAATQMAIHQELRRDGKQYEVIEPSDMQILKGAKAIKIPVRGTLPSGPLYHVFFERVIIDESHRGRGNGGIAKSLYALQRKYTSLLTATPQQNSYMDWFFQLKMARLEPFCHDEDWFRQYFVNEATKKEWAPLEKNRVRILAIMLRGFMLRRKTDSLFEGQPVVPRINFKDHEPIRVIPETLTGTKYPHHVSLGGKSEQCCQEATKHLWSLWKKKKGQHDNPVFERQHDELQKVETDEDLIMLEKILRARQAAVHPLILMNMPIELPSEHLSKTTLKTLEDRAWRDLMEQGDNYRSSTMDAALDLIEQHMRNPKGGVLVYSQYHKVLDLFEIGMRKRFGMECLRRTGRSTRREKEATIERFQKFQTDLRDPQSTPNWNHMVMLMTPTSGGMGLNLPQATRVLTLTPAFNPYVDEVLMEPVYQRSHDS